MRILQLDLGGHRIEFHPYVTVLRGLEGDLRGELIDALAALPTGQPTGGDGLVEAHGVVLDLTAATLAMLDLPPSGLEDLDVVVHAEQLPGGAVDPGAAARAQLERERADAAERLARAEADADRAQLALLASREAFAESTGGNEPTAESPTLVGPRTELEALAAARAALEATADELQLAHARAQRALTDAEERVEHARNLRASSAQRASVAAGELESARGARDPFAAAALEAARERLAAIEAAEEPTEPEPEHHDPDSDLAEQVNRLEAKRPELEASLLALDTVDPFPVQVALSQLKADAEGEMAVSPEALKLADEWVQLTRELGSDSPSEATSGSAIAEARRRLDSARTAVFDAERAARLPEVDRLDVEALDNAHDAVLTAQDRADKRLSGARAKEKVDAARVAEQEILDRLGFRTYAEFLMGTSMLNVDPEREKRLEAARVELAAAEDSLLQLEKGLDAELARAELFTRQQRLRIEAERLLGRDPGDDLEWALRHHRVRVHDGGERAVRLRSALENAGLVLGDETVPRALLMELAKVWLDEQRDTIGQRQRVEQELTELEAELTRAQQLLQEQRESAVPVAEPERPEDRAARRAAQLDEARAGVRSAEQRLERQSEIEQDVAQRKAELEAATQAEQRAADAVLESESELAAAAEAEHASAAEQARVEAELASAIQAERTAADALAALSERIEKAASTADEEEHDRAIRVAEADADNAAAVVQERRAELDHIDAQVAADGDRGPEPLAVPPVTSVEETEWYLLSRLAAQRSVSYAGSVPLVLDDALAGVKGDNLVHLLSRLERMSTAVQLVVVSEDAEVAAWADSLGPDRALTLYPVPV